MLAQTLRAPQVAVAVSFSMGIQQRQGENKQLFAETASKPVRGDCGFQLSRYKGRDLSGTDELSSMQPLLQTQGKGWRRQLVMFFLL